MAYMELRSTWKHYAPGRRAAAGKFLYAESGNAGANPLLLKKEKENATKQKAGKVGIPKRGG